MLTLTVVIPFGHDVRAQNLPLILDAIRAGTRQPDEILVWNNVAPLPPMAGVSVVQSPRNVGCQSRFLGALMAETDLVLYHHDDLLVRPETIERLVQCHESNPDVVWTLHGRVAMDGPYQTWPSLRATETDVPIPVDVSLGRCELVPRRLLPRMLRHYPWIPQTEMDDLWVSASAAREGVSMCLPSMPVAGQFSGLSSQGVGYSHGPGWYAKRDDYARRIIPETLGVWPWRAGREVAA